MTEPTSPPARPPRGAGQPSGRTVLAAFAAPFVGLLSASTVFGVVANLADRPAGQSVLDAVATAVGGAWLYATIGLFLALPATWLVGAPLHFLFLRRGWTGWASYTGAGLAVGLAAAALLRRPLDFLFFGMIGGVTAVTFWWLVHRWR